MSRFNPRRYERPLRHLVAAAAGLACLGAAGPARAEGAVEETSQRLLLSVGLGVATSTYVLASDANASGAGFYGAAEYIYRRVEWATPRAYAGWLIAGGSGGCDLTPCEVAARIGFAGVKGRLLAPIPYVAPFIELGIGISVGSLRTRLGDVIDESSSPIMYHVPFGLGLALGRHHDVDLAIQLLVHPEQNRTDGAFALGLEFLLD